MTCVLALSTASCVVPPVVQPAGSREVEAARVASAAELCAVASSDGTVLRGAFVSAGADAPVVLHLLPSQASITSGVALGGVVAGMGETLEELRAQGWSSLALDYRGVGASEGERDPRRLGDDAGAMWAEALRRAGGDPTRVVVRATSIGSLAAAALLDGGARPAAVVLFAPVRAETVGAHAARERKGVLLGALIGPFLARPLEVDLVSTLAGTQVETLLFLPGEDVYLPAGEALLVERAASRGPGHRVVRLEGSHHAVVLRAWGFTVDEERFAGRLTPQLLESERALLTRLGARPEAAAKPR